MQTDMAKLIVAFRNFAKTSENFMETNSGFHYIIMA
jgi:hypothetical protein